MAQCRAGGLSHGVPFTRPLGLYRTLVQSTSGDAVFCPAVAGLQRPECFLIEGHH
ncbi:hypothetical protein ARZXY2_890 [Arthrobacter sp. ZXY-2]|nr:hypothetical protein ARZXY2_890 [Arthrobacter sp. ZXY-2]